MLCVCVRGELGTGAAAGVSAVSLFTALSGAGRENEFLFGGGKRLKVCSVSLFVSATALDERKAKNAKTPQITRQPIPPETSPPEKPLKADKRNRTARQEKTIVFFFIKNTTFLSFLRKL